VNTRFTPEALTALEEAMVGSVALRLAQSSSAPTGTGSYSYTGSFSIIVRNDDYTKDVAVWAKVGTTWHAISAAFAESLPGNLERWTAPATNDIDKFAIRYTVLGRTDWDNNAGADYVFPKAFDEFNALSGRQSPVLLGQASIGGGQLTALIAVQNLAYSKVVGIIYTTDNWATNHLAYASYNWTMTSGLEVWRLQVALGAATNVKFAVFYFENGNEHWDNNFWRDYAVSPTSAYVARAVAPHHDVELWGREHRDETASLVASALELESVRESASEHRSGRARRPHN
jgi:hypothetical protein